MNAALGEKTLGVSSVRPDASGFGSVPSTAKGWPVWLIVVIAVGGSVALFLLFIICMCVAASTRKHETDRDDKGNKKILRLRKPTRVASSTDSQDLSL